MTVQRCHFLLLKSLIIKIVNQGDYFSKSVIYEYDSANRLKIEMLESGFMAIGRREYFYNHDGSLDREVLRNQIIVLLAQKIIITI